MLERVYGPAPTPGSVSQSLDGVDDPTAAKIKAEAFHDARATFIAFARDGLTIIPVDGPTLISVVTPAGTRYGLSITVTVTDAAGITVLRDLQFNVYNPPVTVWDGTWTYVDGERRDVPNVVEDLARAFQEIVYSHVRGVLAR